MGLVCQLAHWLGCKAGLAGSYIASVLFYLEAATQIHEKLAFTHDKLLMDFADMCR